MNMVCALAFQCCEHLNRAFVVERETAERLSLEIVSVVPVRQGRRCDGNLRL